MKKTNCIIIVVILAVLLTGAAVVIAFMFKNPSVSKSFPHKKLIIDTDAGADDAAALILAAKCESVDILGVTTLVGNVEIEQATKNALMALEMGGSDAPVFKGADTNFSGKKIESVNVFGKDGMGDADLVHPKGKAQEKDAISFILETVAANPGEVEIVTLGPVTNIAAAIWKDPETMKKVKRIWSMGTTGLGSGNASPVAEFNTYNDAAAYKYLLASGIPVTIIGLDMTDGDAQWTDAQFERLLESGKVGEYITDSFGTIRDFYRENGSADRTKNCDALAMMCCLDPTFTKSSVSAYGSCIIQEGESYGQVIFYREGFVYDVVKNDFDYNATLTMEVDSERYFDQYYYMINS